MQTPIKKLRGRKPSKLENQVATNHGLPVYRINPSIPPSNSLATRSCRFEVPGVKGTVIVDNSTREIKGIGGMGFWWQGELPLVEALTTKAE